MKRAFFGIFLLALTLGLWGPFPAATHASNPQFVRIQGSGSGPVSESVTVPLAKAVILELPKNAADVLLTNPATAEAVIRTPRLIYLMGMAVGQTNAFFFDREGRQILNLEIRVERDLKPLGQMFSKLLPRARIGLESVNDNLILTGTVPNATAADRARDIAARYVGNVEQIVNMLNVDTGEQVMLRVRVVEMQRSLAKQLGIDLATVFNSGSRLGLDLATSNPFGVSGSALGGLIPGSIANSVGGSARYNFNSSGTEFIDGALRFFERNGLTRTLAEPNLTTVSGEPANFLAGGEFPVPSARDQDGNVIVTFRSFGVGLGFTPVVLSKGRISLRISTEVSELTSTGGFSTDSTTVTDADGNSTTIGGLTIPGLTVRRAASTVELPSGGSIVIAGLIQESTRQNIEGVPGIKEVPVLGQLFRSRDYLNSETELVVIVTAYLVEPVSEQELVTPYDGFVPAHDLDTILFGRLSASHNFTKNKKTASGLQGPIGYTLE